MNIDNTFTYHRPTASQADRYVQIREKAKELAHLIAAATPSSPEQTLALRDLQRAVMMANAAIAINEPSAPAPVPESAPQIA